MLGAGEQLLASQFLAQAPEQVYYRRIDRCAVNDVAREGDNLVQSLLLAKQSALV